MEHLPTVVLEQILSVMAWMLGSISVIVLTLLGWIGKAVIKRLTGIETQLVQTNSVLATIERDFQHDISDLDRRKTLDISVLDRRVSVIETRCASNHLMGQ